MKKNLLTKLFALMLVFCTLFLNSCSVFTNATDKSNSQDNVATNDGTTNNTEITNGTNDTIDDNNVASQIGRLPEGAYNEGVVLAKYTGDDENVFAGLDIKSVEPLFDGSLWYLLRLNDPTKTVESVQAFADLGIFDYVDFDYIMGADAETESYDVSCNPNYEHDQKKHHDTHNIPDGWDHMNNNGKRPGGSSDVIVAVIDTGVDYNHLDLRNNIWTNPAEIPDNGKDDDGNGYIDDVRGWDCVNDDNDPIDDNGHGTHVAGIIAAENNKEGGVGVAYNCKVMVIKAGNSSGYFNNSDIAEAIQYAYMNGASVINMSFGGSQISVAVEDALENAYNTCILVAAAGNDGACNSMLCKTCVYKKVIYPAALPYVIGVMSVNVDGTTKSSFSNYDHYPYNNIEYEVYAVGSSVYSCWPGNKYATLNGTSMAAPTVAGIAALLRSYYSDREVYSTKYIQSQIVNTGTVNPYNPFIGGVDIYHSVTNVYESLTRVPTPEVKLYDYYIDDSISISNNNNGNGVIDAGETVRLHVSLHNRGGVASDVNVSIDTYRGEIGDETLTDPYFTFVNSTMHLSDIGTYSVRQSGDKYFEIIVDEKCPNDYLVDFKIRFTYKNGMDVNDQKVYTDDGKQKAQFNVSKGYYLPKTFAEDTVYKADRLYIVSDNVVIPEGITVTFEEGCEIQFYGDSDYYSSPEIIVHGTLKFNGTAGNMISIHPSERHFGFACIITNYGITTIEYAKAINLSLTDYVESDNYSNERPVIATSISDSLLLLDGKISNPDTSTSKWIYCYKNGKITDAHRISSGWTSMSVDVYNRNFIETGPNWSVRGNMQMDGNYILVNGGDVRDGEHYYEANFINNYIYSLTQQRFLYCGNNVTENNWFVVDELKNALSMEFANDTSTLEKFGAAMSNNAYSEIYQKYADQLFKGYYDSTGNISVDVYGSLSDASLLWPHIVSVELFNKDGEPITTIGKEEIKVRVTFNRPMDDNAGTFLTFGTIKPYGDYRIDGEYISDTVWEGNYTLKAQIENGQNFLKVNNAWAAEDQTKTVFGEYQLHEFTIDTTAAMAMNLIANPKPEGIELTWAQDDYDTLMGYNIYRSESKDGNFVKINPTILLDTDSTFLDTNAEPGKTYWYTFTVVLSDFSESNPAGKVMATAVDTIAPNIYHTPVNQGYLNNNLVISCTASDNVAIDTLTLYYRAVGATEWKTLTMSKQSDKYSATIFGSELTLDGIEYYVIASDGRNTINKGSAEAPYTVIVKDASAISRKGDVDGDGVVTTKDALMLMQCLNDDIILKDDEFQRADLNGDGNLSSAEALRILQYINGKINTLEM